MTKEDWTHDRCGPLSHGLESQQSRNGGTKRGPPERVAHDQTRGDRLESLYARQLGRAFALDGLRRGDDAVTRARLPQYWHEMVGRHNGIAQRDVDALGTDRRHRVRRVTDHEHTRYRP